MYKIEHNWVESSSDSEVPPLAVLGGYDLDGSPIYVGRALHRGMNLPAKVVPSKNSAYVSWGGQEIAKSQYEILAGENYRFVKNYVGMMPLNAVRAGNTVDGEPIYIGRGIWEGNPTVGKIHLPKSILYIPFDGDEQQLETYEVLIREAANIWVPGNLEHIPPNAVIAGADRKQNTIYVGRAFHDIENLPAKVIPGIGHVSVSHGGLEIKKTEFEVLVGEGYKWVYGGHSGDIPSGAVPTGNTQDGEKIYVGRGYHHGTESTGKVHPGKYCVYIPYKEKEVKCKNYEVLVRQI